MAFATGPVRSNGKGSCAGSAKHCNGRRMDLLVGTGFLGVGNAYASVDSAAFDHGECAGVDVTDDDGGPLHFDAVRCVDGALDASADDCFPRVDVAEYFALAADENLPRGANAALDAALDLDDAVGV